jgi:sugar phosphate isomerase/epimerase
MLGHYNVNLLVFKGHLSYPSANQMFFGKKEIIPMNENQTRRQFLQAVTVAAAASVAPATCCSASSFNRGAPQASKAQLKLGLASYTLRKFNLDQTLAMTNRLGLKYIALKSFHLPLESSPAQIAEAVEKVRKAGLTLYGGGVIYMNNEAQVHQAFDYAKAAGMKVIIGAPAPELLALVNKKVQEYNIKVAIHNHGPGDKNYPTPASAYERIKDLDKRIGLCNDIGHTIRAGEDPSVSAERFGDRLLDVHIKDESQASAKGQAVEVGRGVIDIPKFLRTLLKINYMGVVAFEYEKDADDPLPGLAESVGYVKGVLAAI